MRFGFLNTLEDPQAARVTTESKPMFALCRAENYQPLKPFREGEV